MNYRSRNVYSMLYFRPWMVLLFGVFLLLSVTFYWWLILRLGVLESQSKLFMNQLHHPQSVIRQISVETAPAYKVPEIPDAVGSICETVHLALVCMGKCTRNITPMLKSILHHRRNPLHFHLLVDTEAERTAAMLFDTWDLPDVKYTCYNAQYFLHKVQWIPNSHYSGVFSLVKLLLPEILPTSLTQVIVFDSDLTFLSDVGELWNIIRNMTGSEIVGLVENESNWYYDNNMRWPALGRGYNTGVMLLNLKKIRSLNWSRLWQDAVNENLHRLKQTELADQDIINAIIKKHPSIVYNISCQYNIQMSTKSLAKSCYGEDQSSVKIIHWNSPLKYNIRITDSNYFRSIHQSYVNYDGYLLREKLHKCWGSKQTVYMSNHSDPCLSFREAQRIKLRTHLYYRDFSYTDIDDFDVTLVLQLSMDRLQFLERLVRHWEGPLSVAIYLSDCDVADLERFVQDFSDVLSNRRNIGYHLVFKHSEVHYPVNYLRNVALEHVVTPYVLLMDVDFVPMTGLYGHLRDSIKLINPYPQKKCLVVAAFESGRYRGSLPGSKAALVARLARGGDVQPFRQREWPRGHRATNYSHWRHATEPYEVEWQPDYEPYLVVHRTVPKYDTRFSGFGWNKVSHSVELRAQGYRAVVLPDAFVVHTPHAPSQDITAFRASQHYRICLALLKQEFMNDLKKKYNETFDKPSKADSNVPWTS